MNREYWNLFWTTGMPEAWLMSRDEERIPVSGTDPDGAQSLASPLVGSSTPVPGHVPGSPGNIY